MKIQKDEVFSLLLIYFCALNGRKKFQFSYLDMCGVAQFDDQDSFENKTASLFILPLDLDSNNGLLCF